MDETTAEDEVPDWLKEQSSRVENGDTVTVTVRDLLGQFGAAKRGKHIVAAIRGALGRLGLTTWPNFTDTYIDGEVELRLVETASEPIGHMQANRIEEIKEDAASSQDPVPRVAQLEAANQSLLKICRDEPIAKAMTLMMLNEFSQLPIMQGDRNPDGFVSWKTIGRARARGENPTYVREVMENVEVVRADTPLFEAVERIARHDFVLVEGAGRKISGLVTTYDISLQFHELAKPFLLVSQIEGHLRALLRDKFSVEELKCAKNPDDTDRDIDGVADLNFGEYLRLLQQNDKWSKLGLGLDRSTFLERLERVREIRNGIMHFSPDPLDSADLKLLDDTSRCLAELAP